MKMVRTMITVSLMMNLNNYAVCRVMSVYALVTVNVSCIPKCFCVYM